MRTTLGNFLRRCVPSSLKAWIPVRLKARARAILGIEPWPDLAVRHALFRTPQYRCLREVARPFDVTKLHKPVVEGRHQTSFVLACWFAEAHVKTAFQVGYADARHLFYLSRMGIVCGGTDLPAEETAWVQIPEGVFDAATRRRLLRVDFFRLTPSELRTIWSGLAIPRVDLLFSESTFETLLPWRADGVSVSGYGAMDSGALHALMHERFPEKLEELKDGVSNMIFIEPEPAAGNAGAAFEACAKRLPEFAYTVWGFRPPLDRLFRLSAHYPTRQAVYAFARDSRLLDTLCTYASPL